MKIARNPQDLPSVADITNRTGLEFMQEILDGTLPAAPIAVLMGFKLHAVQEGRVVFRGAPGFDVMHPMGAIHGGWYGTLLDSAMACAVMTRLPKNRTYTTLEYKVNIIRPAPMGLVADCIGTTDHVGRRSGVAHGEIRGVEDGKLYATGSTTCIVMPLPDPAPT